MTNGGAKEPFRFRGQHHEATLASADAVDAAGHWVGNLLQRLRAIEQSLERSGSSLADALKRTVDELEQLTRALLDYVAEVPAQPETFSTREVFANVVLTLERSFQVRAGEEELAAIGNTLAIDAAALGTALGYLSALLAEEGVPATACVTVQSAIEGGRFFVRVGAQRSNSRSTAAGELYRAVVDKYLVGQGGGFCANLTAQGGREWILWLPLKGPSPHEV